MKAFTAAGASFEAPAAMVGSKLFRDLGTVYTGLRARIRGEGLADAYGTVCEVWHRGMRKEPAIR